MSPRGRVELCEALADLTDALCRAVPDGNPRRVHALLDRREALLDELQGLPDVPVAGPERERAAEALGRLLERDRELLALGRAQRAELGRGITAVGGRRRSLQAYRGLVGSDPARLDRLG